MTSPSLVSHVPTSRSNLPTARSNIVWVALPDGAVLFCPDTEIYYGLDKVGALIWEQMLDGSNTVEALCEKVKSRFSSVPGESVRSDVVDFLAELEHSGLVNHYEETSAA